MEIRRHLQKLDDGLQEIHRWETICEWLAWGVLAFAAGYFAGSLRYLLH